MSEAEVIDFPQADIGEFRRGDQMEIGERIVEYLSATHHNSAVISEYGNLYVYERDERVWTMRDEDHLVNIVRRFAGARVFKGMKDGEPQYGELKIQAWANAIKAALALGRETTNGEDFFANAPVGVPFREHFVSLDEQTRKLKVEPLGAKHRVRWKIDADYVPARREHIEGSAWGHYLATVFAGDPHGENKILLMQEFLGACLFGIAGRLQRALMLVGDGSNGKSVFMQVVEALFPDDSRSNVPPQDLGDLYARAALAHSLVNVVQEMPESEMLATDKIKSLISCDSMSARNPYGRYFFFTPRCGQIYSANKLPGARDRTHGFWRRWIVLEFKNEFATADQLATRPHAQLLDRTLAARILKELDLVALWALDGAARLLARGEYTHCPASDETIQTWRTDTDHLTAFVADCLEKDALKPGADMGYVWVEARALYDAYTSWCAPSAMVKRVREPLAMIPFLREIKDVIKREKVNDGGARGVVRYRCRIIGADNLPPGL